MLRWIKRHSSLRSAIRNSWKADSRHRARAKAATKLLRVRSSTRCVRSGSLASLSILHAVGEQAQQRDVLNRTLLGPFRERVAAWVSDGEHRALEKAHHPK